MTRVTSLLLRGKRLRVLSVLLFLFFVAGATTMLVNFASAATAPLAPKVEVSPNRVTLSDSITLTVKVRVSGDSNVSASTPLVNGAGDARLLFGNASVIAKLNETGTLSWTYNATEVGAVYFSFRLSVTDLSNGNVTLSESLSSKEVGISRSSSTFLLGLAIISVYVLLSSLPKFSEESKPHQSFFSLLGGGLGFGFSLISLAAGLGVSYVFGMLGWDRTLVLGFSGSFVALWGLIFCYVYKKEIKLWGRDAEITELGGLFVVLFFLWGFFIVWNAFFELALLTAVGVVGIGKEYIEMETESKTES